MLKITDGCCGMRSRRKSCALAGAGLDACGFPTIATSRQPHILHLPSPSLGRLLEAFAPLHTHKNTHGELLITVHRNHDSDNYYYCYDYCHQQPNFIMLRHVQGANVRCTMSMSWTLHCGPLLWLPCIVQKQPMHHIEE